MKIYGFPTFNATKVLLTAEECGLGYDYVELDPAAGETRTPEHMARHPLGKVPVLEVDGQYMVESAAICRYLGSIGNPTLYFGDARQKAVIDGWTDMVTHHVGKFLGEFFFQEVVKKFFEQEVDEAELEKAAGFLSQNLPVFDKQLATNEFLVDDRLSIADTTAFSYFQIHEVTRFTLDDYSNIRRWYQALRERPSFAAAMRHFPGDQIYS